MTAMPSSSSRSGAVDRRMQPRPIIAGRRSLVRAPLRGDCEPESVGIAHAEDPGSPWHVRGFGVERAAMRLDPIGDIVDTLGGDELQRETLSLYPIEPLGAIVLVQQNANRTRLHGHRPELAVALYLAIYRKAENIPVPHETLLKVLHCERGGHL